MAKDESSTMSSDLSSKGLMSGRDCLGRPSIPLYHGTSDLFVQPSSQPMSSRSSAQAITQLPVRVRSDDDRLPGRPLRMPQSTYPYRGRPRLRSNSAFLDYQQQQEIHHHVHHHLHHHHHTGAIYDITAPSADDEETSPSREDNYSFWESNFPVLTKDLYDTDGRLTRRFVARKMLDMSRPIVRAQARDIFHVEKVVWRGHFSVVVKATIKSTGKPVCIKMISKKCDKTKKNYVKMEQTVLANYCRVSPFLVHLHSSFQTTLHCYMILEYIEGCSLEDRIHQIKLYPEKVAVFYLAEICLGVFHLHQQGVLHRDLRLKNVLLRNTGHVCIIDFAVCKNEMKGCFTSTMVGNLREMAPEMHHNVFYNKAVDYWHLGLMLYRMVHGELPFQGKTRVDIFKSVTLEKEAYKKDLSESTVSLCKALLCKNQKHRLGYEDDSEDMMKVSAFFAEVNWQRMRDRHYTPPYIPSLKLLDDNVIMEKTWPCLAEQNYMFDSETNSPSRQRPTKASVSDLDTTWNRLVKDLKLVPITTQTGGDASQPPTFVGKKAPVQQGLSNSRTQNTRSVPLTIPEEPESQPAESGNSFKSDLSVRGSQDSHRSLGSQDATSFHYVVDDGNRLTTFKARISNFFNCCWAWWGNCCRLQLATCQAVCCGLENVKAPVLKGKASNPSEANVPSINAVGDLTEAQLRQLALRYYRTDSEVYPTTKDGQSSLSLIGSKLNIVPSYPPGQGNMPLRMRAYSSVV